jgi:hypothetical protein
MPSIATLQKNQSKLSRNFATYSDLEKFDFAITLSAERLTALSRRWLRFFVAVAKYGFSGISTSISLLTIAEFRVNKETKSERTTYRALAELETKGFIRRRQCRLGPDRFQTTIDFVPEAFSFYLQKVTKNVSPMPTPTHISAPLPRWQGDKLTSNSHVLTPNLISNKLKSNKYAKKTAEYLNPILYTLLCVLTGAALKIATARFKRELETGENVSGCDWGYWRERWTSLPITHREETARREFVPALLSANYGKEKTDNGNVERLVSAFLELPRPQSPPPPLIGQETRQALDELLAQGFPLSEAETLLDAHLRARARARCLTG